MAYGLICRNCGHQEAEHIVLETENKWLRGYQFNVFNCPGFEYRIKDHPSLVLEYMANRIVPLPDDLVISQTLRRRLEEHLLLISNHYEKRGESILAWRQFVGQRVMSGGVDRQLVDAFLVHDHQQLSSTVLV